MARGRNGLPILSKSNFPDAIDGHAIRNLKRANRGLEEEISDSEEESEEEENTYDEVFK